MPRFCPIPTDKSDPSYKNQLVSQVEPETSYLAINTRMKPFNNVLVRRALNMAIDKHRIVQLLNGRGVIANQLKGMTNRSQRLAGYRNLYAQLMDQAVWVPVDNDVKYVLHGPHVQGPYWAFVHNVHTFFYENLWKN
jgi:hypothetical protein